LPSIILSICVLILCIENTVSLSRLSFLATSTIMRSDPFGNVMCSEISYLKNLSSRSKEKGRKIISNIIHNTSNGPIGTKVIIVDRRDNRKRIIS
jgi:hypothetical protein